MRFMGKTEALGPAGALITTNRRDHYIPQGYLKGFIDPRRKDLPPPLWYFDKLNGIWSQQSPGEVGYRNGCYRKKISKPCLTEARTAIRELTKS